MALRDRLSLIKSPTAPGLRAVADASSFGFVSYTTSALPDRVFVGLDAAERPPSVLHGEAEIDVEHPPSPLEYLTKAGLEKADAWPTQTRKAIARLEALWILIEDRFRLLDSSTVEPLAHQASLVEHVVTGVGLDRVLIADEVGLGKTVEAGMIIKRLAERAGSLFRVLYLTEARLVPNVVEEFERLGLRPRQWSASVQEARLVPGDSDPLVVASMHRAVVNAEQVAESGPWNLIIVDEAHHLTDWSDDGSDPQQRMRLARRLVKERLVPGGRVLLLSGTPHQGSEDRFKNLLRLLDASDNPKAAGGRVIYRTKDDITDWDGQPLFPRRQVNPPTRIDAGADYNNWLTLVHELLTPISGSRAAGWRRAQALQWCASSPQAGLAYLVRLAMRAGLTRRSTPVIAEALDVLRPYRELPPNASIEAVEAELLRAQELTEEGADEVFQDPRRGLNRVLELGVKLIREDAFSCKLDKVFESLDAARDEKFVIFAQPVDTVYALYDRLQRRLGRGTVSLIVGGQDAIERKREIDAFRTDARRRVLVSSRSGGEGINLQIARRLIHFDVPWNPMEMEQRVGRIHRYGSASTVIVDTLVLKDSREQRVLDRSRARLGGIARDLNQDRMEVLFSRTMSLIPMEDLAALMAGENFGPLTAADEERIDRLVTEGYAQWIKRDATFRAQTEQMRTLGRGPVSESDYREFVVGTLTAKPIAGWKRRSFERAGDGNETRLVENHADVLQLPDGTLGYIGRSNGIGFHNTNGNTSALTPFGLNDPKIAQLVRTELGEPSERTRSAPDVHGAGVVLLADQAWRSYVAKIGAEVFATSGAILVAFVQRTLDTGAAMHEVDAQLHCWLVSADGTNNIRLDAVGAAELIRLIRSPRPKRTVPSKLDSNALLTFERDCLAELARKSPHQPFAAVFPIAAVWIEPTSDRVGADESVSSTNAS